ncbi:putative non-specific serine/threonine protein kinase [Helianthus annuus]|nr:putative non-specific serine/threonine protein kinase [Helianthus annuus]
MDKIALLNLPPPLPPPPSLLHSLPPPHRLHRRPKPSRITNTTPLRCRFTPQIQTQSYTNNKLLYNLNERFNYCQWQGVKCVQGRLVQFVLQSCSLSGIFADNTLARLDQLRVLSLCNNSLTGPIPDLSTLTNLKALFFDHNTFAGTFLVSLVSLHRLQSLDLARNNLSGSLPVQLSNLDRLNNLYLEWNRFTGSLPPLNQTTLQVLNVSGNNLTGPIPAFLSTFNASAFLLNPNLCGKVVSRLIIHNFVHLNLGKIREYNLLFI